MTFVRKVLRPFGQAAHLFFRSQVHLSVRGGVRVGLVDKDAGRGPRPQEAAVDSHRVELATIVGELAQCLDADPDIRRELRHLAYLETLLRQRGLVAVDTVPLDVLRKALDQFEGLVSNWAPRGLATLRSKMAVALRERSASEEESGASTPNI